MLVSYIQQYFNTSITVLTNQVWKLLIALFKVPNTGVLTVSDFNKLKGKKLHQMYQKKIYSLCNIL